VLRCQEKEPGARFADTAALAQALAACACAADPDTDKSAAVPCADAPTLLHGV
jgi:hypothetical protein